MSCFTSEIQPRFRIPCAEWIRSVSALHGFVFSPYYVQDLRGVRRAPRGLILQQVSAGWGPRERPASEQKTSSSTGTHGLPRAALQPHMPPEFGAVPVGARLGLCLGMVPRCAGTEQRLHKLPHVHSATCPPVP